MRVSVFEHEKMLTTTDFIFSYLRLQAKREYSILLEGQIFERMTQDGHERGSPPRMKTPFRRVASTGFFFHTEISRSGCSCAGEPGNMVSYLSEKSDAVERETEMARPLSSVVYPIRSSEPPSAWCNRSCLSEWCSTFARAGVPRGESRYAPQKPDHR